MSSWFGIRHVFIFGDSYSSTGYRVQGPPPNEFNALGNPDFPGETTAEDANWVGYVIATSSLTNALVYNFACPGAMVQGISAQYRLNFLKGPGKKPDWAPWTSRDSLFVLWIGINDMGLGMEYKEQLDDLFVVVKSLYDRGARKFVFINVPPTDRSPAARMVSVSARAGLHSRITLWNAYLKTAVKEFLEQHSETTGVIYDVASVFTSVLDDPAKFGFKDSTDHGDENCVWTDMLHPTSKMHRIIAKEFIKVLENNLL